MEPWGVLTQALAVMGSLVLLGLVALIFLSLAFPRQPGEEIGVDVRGHGDPDPRLPPSLKRDKSGMHREEVFRQHFFPPDPSGFTEDGSHGEES